MRSRLLSLAVLGAMPAAFAASAEVIPTPSAQRVGPFGSSLRRGRVRTGTKSETAPHQRAFAVYEQRYRCIDIKGSPGDRKTQRRKDARR